MRHIILVEDDLRLAKLVTNFLQQNSFTVTVLHDGEQAVKTILAQQPDLVILDIMLPGLDGFSICREVRANYHNPILFLTAKDSPIDHVMGLEIGADDYIIKPIDPHVLLARINVALRRNKSEVSQPNKILEFGKLAINKSTRKSYLNNELVELTSHEFELLWLLAENAGEPMKRDDIHKRMIGREYDGLDRTVDVRVSRLRKKLHDNCKTPFRIITVWGKGYMLCPDAWND
ncbi:response regulator [Psychrosphaera sp. B3R10]|uniref:response regulator n=1 Tax=unclassified Psychrosphaera TaxID=2641570 RepID=UPI001C09BAF6|nr:MULTISPECIES: response regulator [unclassified Psychrosphaera]MBU2881566.1 response regulator [Psychrosphaera sp. I2R16]MBU2991179.1 response regulator [Psychrosphaera sp. B3R10]MDO6719490.1 response regulator [Psychrosphaera sp. 1_MG-2023]